MGLLVACTRVQLRHKQEAWREKKVHRCGNPHISTQKAARGLAWDPLAWNPEFLGRCLHLHVSFGFIPAQIALKMLQFSLDSTACDEA